VTGAGAGFSLPDGWELSGLTLDELWLRYITIGGTTGKAQLAAYLHGQATPDGDEHDTIAQAINEHFIDQGGDHPVTYENIPPLT